MTEIDPLNGVAGSTAESVDEERRRRARERKAKQRDREKRQKEAIATGDERNWWESNRSRLAPDQLAAMEKLDAEVRDLMVSMDLLRGEDPELVEIIIEFVKDHPCPHLGRITRDRDIPADWSSGVFHDGVKYWQSPELLQKLYAESASTEIFVKFGLLSGIPDHLAVEFLHRKGNHSWEDAAKLVGYHIDHLSTVSYR